MALKGRSEGQKPLTEGVAFLADWSSLFSVLAPMSCKVSTVALQRSEDNFGTSVGSVQFPNFPPDHQEETCCLENPAKSLHHLLQAGISAWLTS